jgi:hypothetical protein
MASNDAPSWLTPEETPGPDTLDTVPVSSPTPIAATKGTTQVNYDDEKDLPGIILAMRLANMGVSIALMACSVSILLQCHNFPCEVRSCTRLFE